MARRKLSAASDLPDLTPKQQKFCEGILAGMSQADAYKAAYNCQNMSDATVYTNASRLRHDTKIAPWLDAAKYDTMQSHECTLEGHLKELERLKAIAVRSGNVGAAVQAEQLRAKAMGHYVEKHQDVTQYDPVKTLQEIAHDSPELAKQLAKEYSIPWEPEKLH